MIVPSKRAKPCGPAGLPLIRHRRFGHVFSPYCIGDPCVLPGHGSTSKLGQTKGRARDISTMVKALRKQRTSEKTGFRKNPRQAGYGKRKSFPRERSDGSGLFASWGFSNAKHKLHQPDTHPNSLLYVHPAHVPKKTPSVKPPHAARQSYSEAQCTHSPVSGTSSRRRTGMGSPHSVHSPNPGWSAFLRARSKSSRRCLARARA